MAGLWVLAWFVLFYVCCFELVGRLVCLCLVLVCCFFGFSFATGDFGLVCVWVCLLSCFAVLVVGCDFYFMVSLWWFVLVLVWVYFVGFNTV